MSGWASLPVQNKKDNEWLGVHAYSKVWNG